MPSFPVNAMNDPMNDPMKASKYRVTNPNRPEDLYQPLYDRVNYTSGGATQISFFATQLGQNSTLIQAGSAVTKVKTRRDTNLDTSGVVPTKLYQFLGLSLAFIPLQQAKDAANTAAICDDIMRLKNGGWIDFKIIDKPIFQCPICVIPEANPVVGAASTANNVTMFATGAGSAAPVPMYKFAIPITLNPFESFSFNMNFDGTVTLNQGMDILVILHSFMRRPT